MAKREIYCEEPYEHGNQVFIVALERNKKIQSRIECRNRICVGVFNCEHHDWNATNWLHRAHNLYCRSNAVVCMQKQR